MDRRAFLTAAGTLLLVTSLGGAALLLRRPPAWQRLGLPAELGGLAEPAFAEAAAGFELEPLAAELRRRGVLDEDGLDHEALALAVAEDELVLYRGYHYAETELELYALAYLAARR